MTTEYTPVATRHTTVPIPTDDDLQRAATYNASLQALADNVVEARARLGGTVFVGTSGVMISQAGVTAGDRFISSDLGTYFAVAGTNTTYPQPWGMPNDGTPSTYWLHTEYNLANELSGANSGLVRFGPNTSTDSTPNGRIPQSLVQYQVIEMGNLDTATLLEDSVTFNTNRVLTAWSFQFSALAGDIIEGILGPFDITSYSNSYASKLVLEAVDRYGTGGAVTNIVNQLDFGTGVHRYYLPMPFLHTVTATGTTRFQLHVYASNDVNFGISGCDRAGNRIGHYCIRRP